MQPKEIPGFINEVMSQIEAGILLYVSETNDGMAPKLAEFPERVELQLSIEFETRYDDGTSEGGSEVQYQQCWVKIPWPKRST